jgi:hypothetical protein
LRKLAHILIALALLLAAAVAETQPLDRGWHIVVDPQARLTPDFAVQAQGWRAVRVGLSWNAQFEDLRDYMGTAWYRTAFEVPSFATPKRVLLRFHAVDYLTEVLLNGRSVGTHEGGYTPFVFDVTDFVRPGANQLLVRVFDPIMPKPNEPPSGEYPYNEVPRGKQNWYVQTGGMWQGVDLEFRPQTYIERVHITPKIDGTVGFAMKLNPPGAMDVDIKVYDPAGGLVGEAKGGKQSASLKIDSPQLWSPDSPALYTAVINVEGESVTERFGFREFTARNGQFFLNGKPYYMIAALDQDFYPDTIYTAPSETYLRDMMLKAKKLGLNMLRCHIKVCEPAYLRAADEVGLLVWYEIPSWADFEHFSFKAAERGEKTFAAMVERDWNHPSIVIMSVINESWGANLRQAEQRQWLRAAFERAKQLTAPRGMLVVDNSPCCQNFHIKTDINDFHEYKSIPDNHAEWVARTRDFASRPKWAFSPHGDAEPTGQEPLVLSEFGNWGLPELPAKLPWWFDRDFAGREVTRPAGVLERFKQYGFHRIFPDFNALARATQWHQFGSLKFEIEDLRQHESIRGYVITEFTDINWEVNGLMDMWRRPKVYAPELARIQQPTVVFARADQRNYWAGEPVKLTTFISSYGAENLTGAQVNWRVGSQTGRLELTRSCTACVIGGGTITFVAPKAATARRERVWLELRDQSGERIAENTFDVFVYPPAPSAKTAVALAPEVAKLRTALGSAGYRINSTVMAGDLLIATGWTAPVAAHMAKGGKALLLLEAKAQLPTASGLKVTARSGSDLDGNWVTNFNWIDPKSAVFSKQAFGPILGWEAAAVVPQAIIQGVQPEQYTNVFAGIFYGWLNNNAAFAMKTTDGNAILTTFRFDEYGKDPYATYLLDSLIQEAIRR